jgi:hypothetical protein
MFNFAQIRAKIPSPALVFVAAHEAARGIARAVARWTRYHWMLSFERATGRAWRHYGAASLLVESSRSISGFSCKTAFNSEL